MDERMKGVSEARFVCGFDQHGHDKTRRDASTGRYRRRGKKMRGHRTRHEANPLAAEGRGVIGKRSQHGD